MTRILALETTDLAGSVALMDDGNLIAELELDPDQRSAQSLAPGIKSILESAGIKPSEIDLVAVPIGPGSFTGLRVGLTTAKLFAYAAECKIMGLNTLQILAEAVDPSIQRVATVVDAQRGDVVAAIFNCDADGIMQFESDEKLVAWSKWIAELPADIPVTGPFLRRKAAKLPEHVNVLDRSYWTPTAATTARLASRLFAEGHEDDIWTLLPKYSRPSAAEERFSK